MAIKYLSGKRLQGTAAERTALNLSSPPQTSWKELARTTLGSNTSTIATSTFTAKDNIMVLANFNLSGFAGQDDQMSMGNGTIDTSSTSQFAYRKSYNGAADSAATSQEHGWGATGGNAAVGENVFYVGNINNVSSQEKLGFLNGVLSNTAGSGNAPDRFQTIAKYANTSTQINIMKVGIGGNTYASGSEFVVLGYDNDEADSGTNFWQELDSVELSGTSDTLSSGTFTAKKYLWVQAYTTIGSGTPEFRVKFNGDTSTNYANRYAQGGASDSTNINSGNGIIGVSAIPQNTLVNMFIINKSDKEKLVIMEAVNQNTVGAGNVPNREECVGKFANTSSQITSLQVSSGSGDWGSGSYLKVWGAD